MGKYTVYRHTFPNNKTYIGITSLKVEKRWKNGKGYEKCPLMNRAIQKYKWHNIKHDILYTNLSKEEAEKLEIELIKEYKSNNIKYGYNIANGGNSVGMHSEETKKILSEGKKGKKNPMFGRVKTIEEKKRLSIINTSKKEVLCVELNRLFNSTMEAERELKIHHNHISACCKGKERTAGGYHWKYAREEVA